MCLSRHLPSSRIMLYASVLSQAAQHPLGSVMAFSTTAGIRLHVLSMGFMNDESCEIKKVLITWNSRETCANAHDNLHPIVFTFCYSYAIENNFLYP